MKLAFALSASILFGTGAYLLLNRDLVRVVLGIVLVSQAATLTLVASGLTRGAAAIYPLPDRRVSDPLSQAMALTAIVIGLAVTALLLVLVLRVALAFRSRRLDEIAEEEATRDEQLEREHGPQHDSEEAAAR
jgi:multicomponent Na+:H+ antiporter subunit C